MAEYASFLGTTNHTEALDNAAKARVQKNNGYLVGVSDELEVIQATPAAMSVIVSTGEAWVQGVQYVNTAAKTITVDAADATNPRIDRIVVRLTWAADTLEAVYLKGTAAASPSAPALTQTAAVWELSLARILVTVGKTSIVTGDITDERDTTYCGQAACNLGTMHINADGALDAASLPIHHVANPTSAQDAVTKNYGDTTYALLASPAFTGNPTAPTQTTENNSTRIATTAFVQAALTTNCITKTPPASTSGNIVCKQFTGPIASNVASEKHWVQMRGGVYKVRILNPWYSGAYQDKNVIFVHGSSSANDVTDNIPGAGVGQYGDYVEVTLNAGDTCYLYTTSYTVPCIVQFSNADGLWDYLA